MSTKARLRAKSLFEVIPYRIARLNAEMVKLLSHFCETNGVSFQQWRVLSLIGNFGAVAATEICKWTTSDKALVSRVIGQLHRMGLIERRPDAADARKLMILLTPAGEELYAKVGGLMDDNEEKLLAGMSDAQAEQLVSVMRLLEERTIEHLETLRVRQASYANEETAATRR